jgi:hypothetical protein
VSRSAPRRLLLATAVLVAGAALVLTVGRPAGEAGRGRHAFQRAVGGLGLGPALDLGEGAAAYDARLGTRAHGGASIVRTGPVPR